MGSLFAAANAELHLPLDGGGWEGVAKPRLAWWLIAPLPNPPRKGEGVDRVRGGGGGSR